MQLIEITTTPIKYELQIERARLEQNLDYIPKPQASQKFARLDTYTRNTQVQIDTYGMRKNLGMKNNMDLAVEWAQKGKENIERLTQDYVVTGQQLAQIQEGTNISDIVWQKTLQQPEMYTVFLPNGGTEINWLPSECTAEYTPAELSYNFQEVSKSMNYIPGSVKLVILQHPEVNIEYLGDPFYVPPSANPNYVPAGETA